MARVSPIPWGCDGVACPQPAGDFGNPRFREWWLGELREWLATPYAGVWVDDVNLAWRVGNGRGEFVRPVDPRTGRAMDLATGAAILTRDCPGQR